MLGLVEDEFRSKKKEKTKKKEERRKTKRKQKLDVIFLLLLLASVESEGMALQKAHPPPPGYSSVACNAPLYNKRRRSRGGLGGTPSNVWGEMYGRGFDN